MEDVTITVPELAIERLLPKEGLVLLGGRPKEGKSWLAAQIALAFTTGQALGGWLKVLSSGRCQLWALEDGYPITKDKIQKLLRDARPDGLRDLRVVAELAKPLLAGGDEIIRATLAEHPAELIVLDSLFKLAGHHQPTGDISQRDYDVIDRVRRIALDHHCAAVIVMHTRKGASGGDPIENLMGTTGNTAAADAVCELKRQGYNAKLTIVGRTVPRTELEMLWHDGDVWGWTFEGEASSGRSLGETSEEVLAYLEAEGASKPSAIAKGVKATFGGLASAAALASWAAGNQDCGPQMGIDPVNGTIRSCTEVYATVWTVRNYLLSKTRTVFRTPPPSKNSHPQPGEDWVGLFRVPTLNIPWGVSHTW